VKSHISLNGILRPRREKAPQKFPSPFKSALEEAYVSEVFPWVTLAAHKERLSECEKPGYWQGLRAPCLEGKSVEVAVGIPFKMSSRGGIWHATTRVYASGTSRSDRDYRDFNCVTFTGGASGSGGSQAKPVFEQPETIGLGIAQLSRRQ